MLVQPTNPGCLLAGCEWRAPVATPGRHFQSRTDDAGWFLVGSKTPEMFENQHVQATQVARPLRRPVAAVLNLNEGGSDRLVYVVWMAARSGLLALEVRRIPVFAECHFSADDAAPDDGVRVPAKPRSGIGNDQITDLRALANLRLANGERRCGSVIVGRLARVRRDHVLPELHRRIPPSAHGGRVMRRRCSCKLSPALARP